MTFWDELGRAKVILVFFLLFLFWLVFFLKENSLNTLDGIKNDNHKYAVLM